MVAGDYLQFIAPTVEENTIQDVSITIIACSNIGTCPIGVSDAATIIVTEATVGFGFGNTSDGMGTAAAANGPFGSAAAATYKGNIIVGLAYTQLGGPHFFEFLLAGSHPQNFFTSLTPEDGVLLTSASASVVELGGYTRWRWSPVTKPARWEGTGTSTVIFA